MSAVRRPLLLAVRNHLRASAAAGGLALDRKECELTPFGGRPPASCGTRFVGIWSGGSTRTQRVSAGLDRTLAVNVTISWRIQEPYDRVGTDLTEKTSGLDDLVDSVVSVIHADSLDHRILRRANLIANPSFDVSDASTWRYCDALEYQGDPEVSFVGPEWFWAKPEGEGAEYAGVVCTIRFGGVRCVQSYLGGSDDMPVPIGPTLDFSIAANSMYLGA